MSIIFERIKKFSPEEYRQLIKHTVGKDYIPEKIKKVLKEENLPNPSSLFKKSLAKPKEIVPKLLEILKKEKFASSYKGYGHKDIKQIFNEFTKEQTEQQETEKLKLQEQKKLRILGERKRERYAEFFKQQQAEKESNTRDNNTPQSSVFSAQNSGSVFSENRGNTTAPGNIPINSEEIKNSNNNPEEKFPEFSEPKDLPID